MIRLAISVEGKTETEFVKKVLSDHLWRSEVLSIPVPLGNTRPNRARRAGGGNVSVERLVSEMVDLSRRYDAVTSLVDFYGFRRKEDRSVKELEEHLVQQIEEQIPDSRQAVFPYFQKHEFEGLLFSDTAAFGATGCPADWNIEALGRIRGQFETPEDINDSPETAPSKRIKNALPRYDKVLHGPLIAKETGLEKIREECPRFRKWLTRLEGLPEVLAR